jgi:hypothetical protein
MKSVTVSASNMFAVGDNVVISGQRPFRVKAPHGNTIQIVRYRWYHAVWDFVIGYTRRQTNLAQR